MSLLASTDAIIKARGLCSMSKLPQVKGDRLVSALEKRAAKSRHIWAAKAEA
jgi:hypothetical protein